MKNKVGMRLSDEELEKIPHPTLELIIHVTTKNVQLFGSLGSFVIAPVSAYLKKEHKNWPKMKSRMLRMGKGGVILGLVSGPLLTCGIVMTDTDDYKVWDRCYRLRHNRGQLRVDQLSLISTVGGVSVGAATGSGTIFGGLVGMTSGILVAAFYNNVIKK